jgi:hypothetical protein
LNQSVKIAHLIADKLRYQVIGNEYGMIGRMINMYGFDSVVRGIEIMVGWGIPIPHMMNYLQSTVQKNLTVADNKATKKIDTIIGDK